MAKVSSQTTLVPVFSVTFVGLAERRSFKIHSDNILSAVSSAVERIGSFEFHSLIVKGVSK